MQVARLFPATNQHQWVTGHHILLSAAGITAALTYIYAGSMSYSMVLGLYISISWTACNIVIFLVANFCYFWKFFREKTWKTKFCFLKSVKCAISAKKLSLSKNQKNWPKQNIGICMCQRWWHAIRLCMARDCRYFFGLCRCVVIACGTSASRGGSKNWMKGIGLRCVCSLHGFHTYVSVLRALYKF